MSPALLDTICTTTVAMSPNFHERLPGWWEFPAAVWREPDGLLMAPYITLAPPVIAPFQAARCGANPLLAAGNLALARNADNYTTSGQAEPVMFLRGENRDFPVEKSFGLNTG